MSKSKITQFLGLPELKFIKQTSNRKNQMTLHFKKVSKMEVAEVEVEGKLHSPANNLSGGQKQRLCIARTIALEPKIILMDEPCSSLDPISTEKIEGLIQELKGRYTILIVTHNLAQARRVCDYVYVFWYDELDGYGKILESGTCSDVFDHSKNEIIRDYVGGLRG